MTDSFFDLDNPFERTVNERLESYFRRGLPHDMVLDMIGRDFPYMDAAVREHCENTAYLHYFSGSDGNIAATFQRVALLHSKFIDEPCYSHMGYKFHISKGEDLVVSVIVENPLYLYDKANVHLTFHVDGRKVNEFRHTMAMEERRNVYYVPLKLMEIEDGLIDEAATRLKIDVVDENIKGNIYTAYADVYHGEKDPSEVFTLRDAALVDRHNSEDKDVFTVGTLKSLNLRVSLEHDMHYGEIKELEGIVTFSPSDSTDRRNNLVGIMSLSDTSGFVTQLDGYHTIFYTDENVCDGTIPTYKPQPGKYTVNFFVWDTLLWSREIEIVESHDTESFEPDDEGDEPRYDHFDKLLDDFIKEMELELEETGNQPVSAGAVSVADEPETDPSEYV